MSELSVLINDVKAEIAKVEAWFKGVNWNEVLTYYNDFIKGLEQSVLPVIEELFPGTTSTIGNLVTPLLNNATTAVTALTTAASAYAAGTLSSSDLTTAAHVVQSAVEAASVVVGAAVAGTSKAVAAASTAKTAVPASSVNPAALA
ncbi:MAG: hypothetical protein ABSF52_09405 [Syntrophobacteraceae bacterium]|jgi:hypothetical protein